MPISVQVSQNLLTAEGEREIFSQITNALLTAHGLAGNPFLTPNVIGHLTITPAAHSYAGGKPQSLAVIEVKVPSTAFPNAAVKQSFVESVTQIIDRLKAGNHPPERTFVNVTYTVDGVWGIGGKAYSDAEFGAAIQQAAAA